MRFLTPGQRAALKVMAEERGQSMAETMRAILQAEIYRHPTARSAQRAADRMDDLRQLQLPGTGGQDQG